MPRLRVLSAVILILVSALQMDAQQRDLRDQYSTKSLEAAQNISQAIQLSQAKKHKEALAAIDVAVKADPKCQIAYYWKGIILANLGDITESIEAYKMCLSDNVTRGPQLSASAAVNLGITFGKLKEYEDSAFWFTRAILEDSNNAARERGKAYRNLAITLRAQGKHLSAALALALAYQDKVPNVTPKMMRDFFATAEDQEVAHVLHFKEPAPKLDKRTQQTKLVPVSLATAVTEPIVEFLADPQGRYIVAVPPNGAHYYVIATDDKPTVRRVGVGKPLPCASLAEGHLYAVSKDPVKLEQIEVATGKVIRSHALEQRVPSSVAVFPTQGRAYFAADRIVYELNLKTGTVTKTDLPGQVVLAHPNQRFLYSYVKPEQRGVGSGHIIIDGRPYFFQSRVQDWIQTTLFKAVLTPHGLLLAEVRDNAASNAARMSLSPDGHWVAVAGGGGWRPTVPQGAAGYGVAVFSAHNLEQLQGFFKTDAYPLGVCFNPVTGQVAVLRGADAKIYHLADTNNPVEIKGKFTGPVAWSGNGRYLVLANEGGGISLHENTLSIEEQQVAASWWKNISVVPLAPTMVTASFQAIEAYSRFALTNPSREEVAKSLAKAAGSGRTEKPGRWQEHAPYTQEEGARQAIQAVRQMNQREDNGLIIFQLKKALKTNPQSVLLQFFLAEALQRGDQPQEAEKLYVAVVRSDAGRTELSCRALNSLASLLTAKSQDLPALHCLSASLALDKANPQTLALALPLLKKHHFEAEADQFAKLASSLPAAVSVDLPPLPKPGQSTKYSAAELYRKAVWSVVLIKTGKGSGSGVCVGKPDIILTNDHVVDGDGPIEVYPFILKDKSPVRMPMIRATVLLRSAKEDLAVLKLEKAPEHLEPLAVAAVNPNAGDKVYAIGSPGLGRDILEQSISEGLISSKNRILDGIPYLQHSAAVNPGNSGGPLLDEECRLVGIVTLKARLENVSFAVPVETIRAIFKSR
jgi:S1-C subfamily serine protease/Tfp pilus assembly protein PilF